MSIELVKADFAELDGDIRATANNVGEGLKELAELMEQAKASEGFCAALGFDSWTGYVADVFASTPQLSAGERDTAIELMAAEGMSTRAIGAAVNVSQSSVARRVSQNGSVPLPPEVIGLDGRVTKRPIPPPPPEIIDAVLVDDDRPLTEAGCKALDDGGTVTAPEVKPRKSALTAEVKAIAAELESVIDRVTHVAADKRFKGVALLKPLRPGVDRLDAVLAELGYYDYVRTLGE